MAEQEQSDQSALYRLMASSPEVDKEKLALFMKLCLESPEYRKLFFKEKHE